MASYAGYKSSVYGNRGSGSINAWQPSWYRPFEDVVGDLFGYNQMRQKQKSNMIQRDYEQYMMNANRRALNDWYKNVGIPQRRTIKYPEFSYPGAIRNYSSSISRSFISDATAVSNYTASFPFRTAGLYGILGRPARYL